MPSVSSPLSPRTEAITAPSQSRRRPNLNSRQSSNVGPAAHLRLPSLPRFHPANFASANSSTAATPVTGPNSPQAPVSPRSSSRQYEVQKQMYHYQQQLLANTNRQVRGPGSKPTSPRLEPMASPGAVTPLELEGADGYLTAGLRTGDVSSHVEKLIRDEAKRHGRTTSVRSS
ncbi:hypothetical protein P153DRAFT_297013 [Dothidotthia symphoricarpi CBS 119687]|uniref:Uncharacterized protein n=1 Tax=Dothidotthia symphoricarpi CBS 119687 TaxID=1392245 RepID=A0A6A6A527_9PLEO|nr:uncharacterized protein P153DRAFT_297013 [Dothidotthia symphoricarpi CBS 119687]KAF2126910.1 hypothetical protein P153DRAFT_297013 [Dothidotthia symphoricarpi CBS 119687]